ncbi:MAG: hypothetical protein WBQ32_08850 [Ignavibacteriaceae bacterium]
MKQTFWCPLCSKTQAMNIKFLPLETVEVLEKLNYGDLVNEDSFSFYSPTKDLEEEFSDQDFFQKIEEIASISFKADIEK